MDTGESLRYVRITNGLPFAFQDRHDGVPVTIQPGKSENLHPDMALHFFGYTPGADRASMLKHTAKRHGWNTSDFVAIDPVTGKSKAEDYFDKIGIKAVMYRLVPVENDDDPQKPVPADPDVREPQQLEETRTEDAMASFKKPRMVPKRFELPVSGPGTSV